MRRYHQGSVRCNEFVAIFCVCTGWRSVHDELLSGHCCDVQAVAKEFGLGAEESEDDDDDDDPRPAGTSQQEVVAQAISQAQSAAASMVDNSGVDPVRAQNTNCVFQNVNTCGCVRNSADKELVVVILNVKWCTAVHLIGGLFVVSTFLTSVA